MLATFEDDLHQLTMSAVSGRDDEVHEGEAQVTVMMILARQLGTLIGKAAMGDANDIKDMIEHMQDVCKGAAAAAERHPSFATRGDA